MHATPQTPSAYTSALPPSEPQFSPESSSADVRQTDGSMSAKGDSAFNDQAREKAIERAGKLVEFFISEQRYHQAVYEASSHLADKAAADAAWMNAKEAQRLMVVLIRGRSAEMAARLLVPHSN